MLPLRLLPFLLLAAAPAVADESRRFFDFTPVSAANPVVATIGGTIEIPLSELRGYRDAERPQAVTDPANLAQKRAVLEDLLNEYIHVDEAYRTGVPASPGFARQMEATRTMILTDFMAARAADEKLVTVPEAITGAALAMAEKLFAATAIEVSNEAYALLKRSAQLIDEAAGPPAEVSARLQAIVGRTPEAVLVRYEERSISVHQILAIYAGLPAARRPAVQTQAGLIDMIKPLILPELMALEATRRGIAAEPAFQQKLIQNRNALLRFHTQGQVERRAVELMNEPGIEAQLHAWYEAHRADYALVEAGGQRRPATFAEARARIEGDYSVGLRDRLLAERVQELRKARTITVDEAVLRSL